MGGGGGEGDVGEKSGSDVFLNHYTASGTLCVTLSVPPSAAVKCQASTTAASTPRPRGQITVR